LGPRNLKLRNKVALVTGAGRGIGKAIALEFAREGANLAIVSRTKSELDIAAAQTKELGAQVMARTVDVADQSDVNSFVHEAADKYGRIDVLVNNAGVLGPAGPLVDSETQKWLNTLMVNLVGT
jgi:NAD(P)-dependent dehydrogenase (short-subunit alcohol dehydrogenase family)